MRFRLSELLLSITLGACVLAWLRFLWIGAGGGPVPRFGEYYFGILLMATILILAYGSRIWPNLVPNTGAILLMIVFGFVGISFVTVILLGLFGWKLR